MGKYNSKTVMSEININRGIRTVRNPKFIRIKHCKTNYVLYSSFYTACRAFNFAALFIDPTLPTALFAKKLEKILDNLFGDLCTLRS